jgi:hypothetical protein
MKSIISASENENGDAEEMTLRKELTRLDIQRKSMEQEADVIVLELTTPPEEGVEPMGIDTPLIDKDGYPRGDVDILRARTLRQRFQILKNDHKAIEQNIDGMLTRLAAMKVRKKKKKNGVARRVSRRKEPTNVYHILTMAHTTTTTTYLFFLFYNIESQQTKRRRKGTRRPQGSQAQAKI